MQVEGLLLVLWLMWVLLRRLGDSIFGGKREDSEIRRRVEAVEERKGFPESSKGKVYAVRRGYHPGLYGSWSECEQEVRGFKGAQFRGFWCQREAEAYLGLS